MFNPDYDARFLRSIKVKVEGEEFPFPPPLAALPVGSSDEDDDDEDLECEYQRMYKDLLRAYEHIVAENACLRERIRGLRREMRWILPSASVAVVAALGIAVIGWSR